MGVFTYIYALHDPRDWSIRYVGKSDNPHVRLLRHRKAPRQNPIKQLVAELGDVGLQLQLTILQRCAVDQWQYWERFWILTAKDSGANLANVSPGGFGPIRYPGHKLSDETKRKISQSHKGKTVPLYLRKQIGDKLRGRKLPPEVVAKVSKALKGIKRAPDFGKKISAAKTGKKASAETIRKRLESRYSPSLETRKKIATKLSGGTISEETRKRRSISLRKSWIRRKAYSNGSV